MHIPVLPRRREQSAVQQEQFGEDGQGIYPGPQRLALPFVVPIGEMAMHDFMQHH